ncbi:hypothetical protein SNE35_18125 [Paucibacter sp. R3-3]|uniref:Ribbon-helix-helix protein CopG domain-containing protein n=1 Tax=Roseateles agri TaxID=3098619 RepID=A0ABU5DJG3_9BURK|nr:hypothetical protein [Paucibacter sp. R3-3]MDY0746435.1 hypothetical protein [Paucibacter sp. R3-3]
MSKLILRSFYLSPELDEELRLLAFTHRVSKGDLIRKFIEIGIRVVRAHGDVPSPTLAMALARTEPSELLDIYLSSNPNEAATATQKGNAPATKRVPAKQRATAKKTPANKAKRTA